MSCKCIKKLLLFPAIFLAGCGSLGFPIPGRFTFISSEEGKRILSRGDMYLNNMRDHEYAILMTIGKNKIHKEVSRTQFISFIENQALEWNKSEINRIKKLLGTLIEKLSPYDLKLPGNIGIIKTTGKEEGFAPYCRGNNVILPVNSVLQKDETLEEIILHELYHIYSRNNLQDKEELYGLVGFNLTGELSLSGELQNKIITNPDAPYNNAYITVKINKRSLSVMPLIVTNYRFEEKIPQNITKAIQLIFVPVIPGPIQTELSKSEQTYYTYKEIDNLFEVIGQNSSYIIHPEEILASNFTLMVLKNKKIRSPGIIKRMEEIFKKKAQ